MKPRAIAQPAILRACRECAAAAYRALAFRDALREIVAHQIGGEIGHQDEIGVEGERVAR
jgi:hypothetical protein